MIKKKEPSVKKSIRLPFELSCQIDDICEENGLPYTEVLRQLLLLGLEELSRMDQEEKGGE